MRLAKLTILNGSSWEGREKWTVEGPPQVDFFILAGNHDLSRDATHVSALQLFEMMVPNVYVLTKPTRIGDDLLQSRGRRGRLPPRSSARSTRA